MSDLIADYATCLPYHLLFVEHIYYSLDQRVRLETFSTATALHTRLCQLNEARRSSTKCACHDPIDLDQLTEHTATHDRDDARVRAECQAMCQQNSVRWQGSYSCEAQPFACIQGERILPASCSPADTLCAPVYRYDVSGEEVTLRPHASLLHLHAWLVEGQQLLAQNAELQIHHPNIVESSAVRRAPDDELVDDLKLATEARSLLERQLQLCECPCYWSDEYHDMDDEEEEDEKEEVEQAVHPTFVFHRAYRVDVTDEEERQYCDYILSHRTLLGWSTSRKWQ